MPADYPPARRCTFDPVRRPRTAPPPRACGEALERPVLDAAHALRRQAQPPAGLAQWRRVVAVDAVAQPDHLPLLLGELLERAVHRLLAQADLDLLLGLGPVARQQLAQLGLALLADRPVEARDRAACTRGSPDLRERDARPPPPSPRRSARARASSPARAPARAILRSRCPMCTGIRIVRALVREAALDRLADPEGRVGRELVALAPVELLGGADQAEDALLDQVEQRQLVPLVLLASETTSRRFELIIRSLASRSPRSIRLASSTSSSAVSSGWRRSVAQEELERVARSWSTARRWRSSGRARAARRSRRSPRAARLEPVRSACASSSASSSSLARRAPRG